MSYKMKKKKKIEVYHSIFCVILKSKKSEFHQTTFYTVRHQMLVGQSHWPLWMGSPAPLRVTTMSPIVTASVISGKQFKLTSP